MRGPKVDETIYGDQAAYNGGSYSAALVSARQLGTRRDGKGGSQEPQKGLTIDTQDDINEEELYHRMEKQVMGIRTGRVVNAGS